jgi:PAS domain S-box-containing protein
MSSGWPRWLYLVCLLGMLACVITLGHYGAILIGQGVGQKPLAKTVLPDVPTEAWFRAIVTKAPDAVLVADTAGVIRLWNHGAERIFGTPASQAIGQSLDLIIPENLRQRHWQGWAKVMLTGNSRYGANDLLRVPAIRGDGSRFPAEFSIVMLEDEAGKVTGVAAILRDASAQWEREKALKARPSPPS